MEAPDRTEAATACAPSLPALAQQHQGAKPTRIYLASLAVTRASVEVGRPEPLTARTGFVNQPAFAPGGDRVYFTWRPADSQADVWVRDLRTGDERAVTCTSEEEYVPSATPDGRALTAVHVGADLASTLVELGQDGRARRTLFPDQRTVASYRWADDQRMALVVSHPGAPFELLLGDVRTGELVHIAEHVRGAMAAIPGAAAIGYVDDHLDDVLQLMRLDVASRTARAVIALPDGADHAAWLADGTLLTATGTHILRAAPGATSWSELVDLAGAIDGTITRLVADPTQRRLAIVVRVER